MYVLVSYDVVDDRMRSKLAKHLKEFGNRIQKSVFECDLDERLYEAMRRGVEKIVDRKRDSVRFYRLCRGCLTRVVISGWGEVKEDEGFEVI